MKYNPVVPSALLELSEMDSSTNAFLRNFNDVTLKVGIIIASYHKNDKKNVSKTDTEYDVLAFIQDQNKASSPMIYSNCMASDSFGGMADYFEHTKRSTKTNPLQSEDIKDFSGGTVVLFLCTNGNSEQGIIIGGLRHEKRETKLTEAKGHHLEAEFNGINFQINKDGELKITYKSKTDNDGKPKDEKAGGTTLNIDKTGQVDVNTGLSGADETYIRMDKSKKDIGLKAGNHIGLTAKSNIQLKAEGKVEIAADADFISKAEGSAALESGGAFDLKAGGAINIKGASGSMQFDGSCQIQASTLNLSGQQTFVGQGGQPAVILSTQCMGTGNKGAPVISTFIGPFSSSVFIAG